MAYLGKLLFLDNGNIWSQTVARPKHCAHSKEEFKGDVQGWEVRREEGAGVQYVDETANSLCHACPPTLIQHGRHHTHRGQDEDDEGHYSDPRGILSEILVLSLCGVTIYMENIKSPIVYCSSDGGGGGGVTIVFVVVIVVVIVVAVVIVINKNTVRDTSRDSELLSSMSLIY